MIEEDHEDLHDLGDEDPRIGHVIRQLRTAKKLSLAELAAKAKVSVGMLSQIERERANPSLRTLTRIRLALEVPLSALFQGGWDESESDYVRRKAARPILNMGPKAITKELLSPAQTKVFQFMIINIPAFAESGEEAFSYKSEKGGLMLAGELLLKLGDKELHLFEGDSFQFDGATPHGFRNPTDQITRVLWIIG